MSSTGLMRSLLAILAFTLIACGEARAACTGIDPDHGAWNAIVQRWVRDGKVDYGGIRNDGGADLERYLANLSGACSADYERWNEDQRLAFWINAYNAFTVKLILDHYPIASIRKIGWLPGAAFRRDFIPMQGLKGGTISLEDIEHGTLRADFDEPRIHFALVCAARSCPPLRGEAYRAAALDRQLDDQGRRFLGDPSKNRFDAAGRTLYLSSIFKWFREDFEKSAGSLKVYVARYLGAEVAEPDVEIEFLDYDWSLNER